MMHSTKKRNGFTLVEILVVILLISLLAVFVVPRYIGQAGQAKRQIAKAQIADLENCVQLFWNNCNRYPTQAEGLRALVEMPSGLAEKWRSPYCKESQLLDPWGNAFLYRYPGLKGSPFDIVSYGADSKEGGEGDAADISNN